MIHIKTFQTQNDLNNQNLLNFESPHIYSINNSNNVEYENRYERLSYISSTATGGQYIDLGCKLMENTNDIQIDVKFNFKGHGKTGVQQSTFIASQPEVSPWPGFTCRIVAADITEHPTLGIEFCTKWQMTNTVQQDGNRYLYENYTGSNYVYEPKTTCYRYVNNVYEDTFYITNIPAEQCHNMNTHLFCAVDSSGQPFRFSEVDLYYMRIYKGGTLIRSLWPVKRKSDNVIGLYDSVNDYLYVSQGDDPFVGTEINKVNTSTKYLKNFQSQNNLINYKKLNFEFNHIYYINNSNIIDYESRYEELSYISSTASGGQYIDLGCHLLETTDDIQIDIKFRVKGHGKNTAGQSVLLACKQESSPYPGFVFRTINTSGDISNSRLDFNAKWEFTNAFVVGSTSWFTHYEGEGMWSPEKDEYSKLVGDIIEDTFILDNIPSSQIINLSTTLFAGYDGSGNPFRFIEADIYYMKIYKGGTLIRNLYPAKRKSDNAIGLYDSVNDYLYVSQGDNPFIGPS